jgi:hypothetical protein
MMNLADGSPTLLYYAAREINREFVALATELQSLRSLAVYHAGTQPEGATALPAEAAFRLDPPLEPLEPEGPARGYVVGCFGTDETPTHALVVNLDYSTYSGIAQPRQEEFRQPTARALVGPGPLEVFDPDTGQWTAVGVDRVSLRLPPAGGLLVRVAE